MEGWYVADQDESQFPVSTGRLNISVTNLPEFKKIDFDIKGDE